MPDHLHLVVEGELENSDCKAFIKAAKQYRVIRDDQELAMAVRYIAANPARAGLVEHPRDYAFLGSLRYTVQELLEWCEYSEAAL